MSNRQRYLWRGFLIGFSIVAILTIASARFVGSVGFPLGPQVETVVFIILGLATAVGTGLLGMLIGYIAYRIRP